MNAHTMYGNLFVEDNDEEVAEEHDEEFTTDEHQNLKILEQTQE